MLIAVVTGREPPFGLHKHVGRREFGLTVFDDGVKLLVHRLVKSAVRLHRLRREQVAPTRDVTVRCVEVEVLVYKLDVCFVDELEG